MMLIFSVKLKETLLYSDKINIKQAGSKTVIQLDCKRQGVGEVQVLEFYPYNISIKIACIQNQCMMLFLHAGGKGN